MSSLQNKHILLGISGGIAAYKCPELVRQLKKQGAEVRIIMTESARHFVSELSLQAVSGNKVSIQQFDQEAELSMSHIELAKWADLLLIAPATANIIAKITAGIADDLLSTTSLATTAPVVIAPAMNQQMYQAEATQHNLQQLEARNITILGPAQGIQACGDNGLGRMLEPHQLVEWLSNYFNHNQQLSDLHITITAGPTIEPLDPVRYISNYSSGKMGYAIAKAAASFGAKVTLISGPVNLSAPQNMNVIKVNTALEMNEQALYFAKLSDIFIGCAAVADYRLATIAEQKIKKSEHSDTLTIQLIKNPDIIANVASMSEKCPFVVGFAAESNNIEQYALDKLHNKNLDLICANDISNNHSGFNAEQNELMLYTKNSKKVLPLADKKVLAKQLIEEIISLFNHQNGKIE